MSLALLRRLERLENPKANPWFDPCEGLAQRLAAARAEAEAEQGGDDEENEIERYHKIKLSKGAAEIAEAERLRRLIWPHLNRH